jgi:hypothetical protein
VIAAPTALRRRALAAAGVIPPRRSRAAAATAVLLAGLVALGGCATGSGTSSQSTGDVFATRHQVSASQVNAEVTALYSAHPALASFTVQDVAYTAKTRATVLHDCTTPGSAGGSQDAETGQIVACAPLIFYYYSYGRQASVPAAVALSGDIYWYALDHITGPVDVRASLNQLLQGWKVPVPGLTAGQKRTVVASSVLTAADDTMLTESGVHMVITDQAAGGATGQRITADLGGVTGTEQIEHGSAVAEIRITRQAAYFTGSKTGLTSYIGLSDAAAAKAGRHWVIIDSGTAEYQDLSAENTLSALPSSILPAASQVSKVSTTTLNGQKVYILDWTTTPSGSKTPISARLTVAASPKVLPVSETLTTTGEFKTVTFSNWGKAFKVAVPAQVIPYAQVKG